MIPEPSEWDIEPVTQRHRLFRGRDYFALWSSLGVGLLVFSAGSFLSTARFLDSILAIIIGSLGGSLLLALAGKIGSDHGIPSLISMRPSFGICGSYLPAILNIIQLIGWTTFEIMIISKSAEALLGANYTLHLVLTFLIGALVTIIGVTGPITIIKKGITKFAIWIVYASSAIIVISLVMSGSFSKVISSPGNGMSFFSALDIVIAMPISWLPLVSDYNRFATNSKSAFRGTFLGFAITNMLFYFGGVLMGVSDIVALISAIQSLVFGSLLLIILVDETDNAFADVYSAAVSTQSIIRNINQRYLIIAFMCLSTILAIVIPIIEYETFLLLIGSVFVPLFGVVLADYYIVKRRVYSENMMYGKEAKKVGYPAIVAWIFGILLYYLLSSISPIYVSSWPTTGATIPSFMLSSLAYLTIIYRRKVRHQIKKLH